MSSLDTGTGDSTTSMVVQTSHLDASQVSFMSALSPHGTQHLSPMSPAEMMEERKPRDGKVGRLPSGVPKNVRIHVSSNVLHVSCDPTPNATSYHWYGESLYDDLHYVSKVPRLLISVDPGTYTFCVASVTSEGDESSRSPPSLDCIVVKPVTDKSTHPITLVVPIHHTPSQRSSFTSVKNLFRSRAVWATEFLDPGVESALDIAIDDGMLVTSFHVASLNADDRWEMSIYEADNHWSENLGNNLLPMATYGAKDGRWGPRNYQAETVFVDTIATHFKVIVRQRAGAGYSAGVAILKASGKPRPAGGVGARRPPTGTMTRRRLSQVTSNLAMHLPMSTMRFLKGNAN